MSDYEANDLLQKLDAILAFYLS